MQDRAFKNEKIEFIWDTVVEDIHDVESDWGTLDVTIPRSRAFNTYLQCIFERFPNAFPILRHIFGLIN